MLSLRRITPLLLLLSIAVSLNAQTQQPQPQTQQLVVQLENTAHCDADVRITQSGRAVVSRVTVTQLDSKTIKVQLLSSENLLVQVQGRQCNFGYSIQVPIGNAPKLSIEIADKPEMAVARNRWSS